MPECHIPQFPVPAGWPSAATSISVGSSTTCSSFMTAAGLTAPVTCTGSAGNLTINPNGATVSIQHDITVSGTTLTLAGNGTMTTPAAYDINSLYINGSSAHGDIASGEVDMTLVGNTSPQAIWQMSGGGDLNLPADKSAKLVMNIATPTGTISPINMSGGSSLKNLSFDSTLVQINYGGSQAMKRSRPASPTSSQLLRPFLPGLEDGDDLEAVASQPVRDDVRCSITIVFAHRSRAAEFWDGANCAKNRRS